MSDANRTTLAYVQEDTFGITPEGAQMTALRFTGESLSHQKTTVVSNEIRADRQRSDLAMVGVGMGGNIEIELTQAEYQEFILAALCAAEWTEINVAVSASVTAGAMQTLVTTAGGFAAVPVGGYVKLAGLASTANNGLKRVAGKSADNNTLVFAGGSFTADGAAAPVTITGKDARNGIKKTSFTLERQITNSDETKSYQSYVGATVEEFNLNVASMEIVTGSFVLMGKRGRTSNNSYNSENGAFATGLLTAGVTPAVDGDTITIGSRVYTLVAVLTESPDTVLIGGTPTATVANFRAALAAEKSTFGVKHTAMTANAQATTENTDMDATAEIRALVMGTAANAIATTTTAAADALIWAEATLTGGAEPDPLIPPTTNPVMNGTSNVGSIYTGGRVATERFKTITLQIKNNHRAKDCIGELGPFELGQGTIDITGSIEAYFQDNNLYTQLIEHEYTGLSFTVTDSLGKSLAFTIPYLNFGTGDPFATGINTDIMISPSFQGIMHPILGCSIIINAFD